MKFKFDDLEIDFEFQKTDKQRDRYLVTFYRNGERLPGSLDGYSPSPLIKSDDEMVKDAVGFATSCPYWEFDEVPEEYEANWKELYTALGGEHSVYSLLAEDETPVTLVD